MRIYEPEDRTTRRIRRNRQRLGRFSNQFINEICRYPKNTASGVPLRPSDGQALRGFLWLHPRASRRILSLQHESHPLIRQTRRRRAPQGLLQIDRRKDEKQQNSALRSVDRQDTHEGAAA